MAKEESYRQFGETVRRLGVTESQARSLVEAARCVLGDDEGQVCPVCGGTGIMPDGSECPECSGTGTVG